MTDFHKKSIQSLLSEKRLAEAFAELRQTAQTLQNWQLNNRLDELEESYKYMIRYVADGCNDPQREEIHNGITAKLMELADITEQELTVQNSPKLYYETLRMERKYPRSLEALLEAYRECADKTALFYELPADKRDSGQERTLLMEKEKAANAVFKHIWVTFPVTANEAGTLDKLFADADATAEIKELAMAATMLSLLEHYSEHLLLSLLDLFAANAFNDASLSMKALCCALIAMHCHRETIKHSSAISLRIANIADSERGRRDIMTVFLQFIRSRSTERISQKVRDELVPKLMKLSPEMRRKMRDGFSDDIEEMAKNPDWQEMLNESGITDKMQELSRMQAEGSDVFLSSFARLKSFPFFNDVANWFVPFTPRHSSIFRVFAGNSGSMLLSMVDRTGAFCDSDKFSFALSVATMPDQHRSMMMAQFDEQQEQVINEMAGSLPNPDKQRENIANKYVQSLYRFFNLFRSRNDFYNPFSTRLNLIDVPFVSDALSDTKSLRLIAEFYFSMQCYTDALSTFGKVFKQDSPTASDYQKTGYCHEQLKQYVLATADYEKVELLKPNDVWTLKHLALCYRAVNDTEKAIANYKRAEALQPDNVALANNIANCLLEGGRIEEALKYFFKVDYLASKGERTMRPIAWCSFLIGNYSQSVDYYNRIIAKQPGANDYINRGHALLCSGQVKDAVASYMDAVDKSGGSEVLKTLDDDRHYLLDAGVDKLTIALIFDKIRYKGLGTSENM